MSKLDENWYREKVGKLKESDEKVERMLKSKPCKCDNPQGLINTHTYEYCKNCWGVITYKDIA